MRPKNGIRSKAFMFMMTDSEHIKLAKMAGLQSVSMNEFIRRALNEQYKKMRDQEIDRICLEEQIDGQGVQDRRRTV